MQNNIETKTNFVFVKYLFYGILLATIPIFLNYFGVNLSIFEKKYYENEILTYTEQDDTSVQKQTTPTPQFIEESIEVEITQTVFRANELGNYEPRYTYPRNGLGEQGQPVILNRKQQILANKTIAEYGYNIYVSDRISLDREISDTRFHECKFWAYPSKLPKTSVIITFFNEAWSTLIRTIHSVINTTPAELLEEIILVDDFSSKEHLKDRLTRYVKKFRGLVKLYRNKKREGLIRSRVYGVKRAKGEVIVILDAHVEPVVNWLPPLLATIVADRKTLAIPIIDRIDWNTFEHKTYKAIHKPYGGIFEWGLLYKEMILPENYTKHRIYESEPYYSPTHAGGLFAIDKNWFFKLGLYDTGIKIWGGEQYELSFKVWQCGGNIKWIPCSRIAHIYKGPREPSELDISIRHAYQIQINNMRVTEVWMDEYKEYFYIREPYTRELDYGDISERIELRKRLKCQSFKWYMDNVAFALLTKYPIPPKNHVWGECYNPSKKVCLDNKLLPLEEPIGVSKCNSNIEAQLFRLNVEGELANGELCYVSDGNLIKRVRCVVQNSWIQIGEWEYKKQTKQMFSKKEHKCIETKGRTVYLAPCDNKNINQKWQWREIYV